ncbi:MAG: VTT domain-containing protein [Candidatus Micrarchaeia archaeon]
MKKEFVGLILVVLFIIAIYLTNPAETIKVDTLGYLGVFLLMFLSSATIVLPVPGLAGVVVAGCFLNPFLVGVVGGVGSALGETTGYIAGLGGKAVVERGKRKFYNRIRKWMKRNGFITIFIAAALPNPFFDVAGLAAGALDYPFWKFLLACMGGKIIKCIALAYLGYALV